MKKLSPFSRRDMLRAGGAASLLAAGHVLLPAGSFAKAPMQDAQVPGFFRFHVGAFEITVLSDGNLILPAAGLAINVPEVQLKGFLRSNMRSTQQRVGHINAALINTGAELILIDVGSGANFQSTAGKLAENLEASGYSLDQVDKVIMTHAHPDHIWGLTDEFEGAPRYANASYVMSAADWDFWTAKETGSKVPASIQGFAIGARKHLLPLAKKTKMAKANEQIVQGITLVSTPGHSPGHSSVLIEQGDDKLLITADAITDAQVSFEHPDWHPGLDLDPEMAVKSRKSLLKMAAAERLTVLGYHLPFPGVGHVAARGNSYRWVPSSFEWAIPG